MYIIEFRCTCRRAKLVSSLLCFWHASCAGIKDSRQLTTIHIGRSGELIRRSGSFVHESDNDNGDGTSFLQINRKGRAPDTLQNIEATTRDETRDASEGVVCPTWLHKDIQEQNLKPFVQRAGVSADGFVKELSRLCGTQSLSSGSYTGSWEDHKPVQNDVRVLAGLTQWSTAEKNAGKSKNLTWTKFAKPNNDSSLAGFVQHIMTHPRNITPSGNRRILDFGCGGAEDISAVQGMMGTSAQNTLCLDVFPVHKDTVTPHVLNTDSASAYRASLEKASVGNENSVHVAISMVTFHHIPDGQMRQDALNFVHKVLAPGGIFIIAEWDNSVKPDRWIHYDLVHVLPTMLFYGAAPGEPEQLEMGTRYLTVADWVAAGERAGLKYDKERSLSDGFDPSAVAAKTGNANRDFHLVFTKVAT